MLEQEGTTVSLGNTGVTGVLAHHLPGNCDATTGVLSRIGDKWSILVIMLLAAGPCRFNELKRLIGGVSQRMLTRTLRGLERDGMVTRTAYATIPPRVDYALTPLGQSLCKPVEALGLWAFSNLATITEARMAFDHRTTKS